MNIDKTDIILTSLIFVFTTLMVTSLVGAVDSGSIKTNTSLSFNLENGITSNIYSETLDSGNQGAYGHIDYFALTKNTILGPDTPRTEMNSSTPSIEFTTETTKDVWVIQIPIKRLEYSNFIHNLNWRLSSGGSEIISGEISDYHVKSMISNNGYILIVIGSLQTDDSVFDRSNPITLNAGITYELELSTLSDIEFVFNTQQDSTTNLLDGGISTNYSPKIILYEGSKIGREYVTDGISSISYTPTTNVTYILGYFGDFYESYASSHDMKYADIKTPPSYTLDISNKSVNKGDNVTVEAILLSDGNAVINKEIKFDLEHSSKYLDFIGYNYTSSSGIASLTYLVDKNIGKYSIRAYTIINDKLVQNRGNLTVIGPKATFSGIKAEGFIGTGTGNRSIINISGKVITSNYETLSDIEIELYEYNSFLNSSTTNQNGKFSFTTNKLLEIGSYSDIYHLHANTNDYVISNKSLTIDVYRGNVQISTNHTSSSINYLDPYSISGNISDSSGDPLNPNIYFELFNGSWNILETVTSSNFIFTIDSSNTGQYTYRVRTSYDENYNSQIENIDLTIDKGWADISTDQSTYEIPYHEYGEFKIDLSYDQDPVEEPVLLTFNLQNVNASAIDSVHDTLEITNGSLSYNFVVPDPYLAYPFFDYYIIISATSSNLEFSSKTIYFRIIPTDLYVSLEDNVFTYNKTKNITLVTIDAAGYKGAENESLIFELEGTNYTSKLTSDGKAILPYNFTNIGDTQINIHYLKGYPYYYNSYSFNISVIKANYQITTNSRSGSQGEYIIFKATITDQNGYSVDEIVDFYIFDDDWVKIGTNQSVDGKFQIKMYIGSSFGIGSYDAKFTIAENQHYFKSEIITFLYVENILTKFKTDYSGSYHYNAEIQERTISMQLTTRVDVVIPNHEVSATFAGTSYNKITDDNGYFELILPKRPSPGVYELKVTFNGSTLYNQTIYNQNITVLGSDLSINWLSQPNDEYYGEYLLIEFQILDNEPIGGIQVDLFFNEIHVGSKTSNDSGYVTFTTQMVYSDDNLDIHISIPSQFGWNSVDKYFNINQIHRQLDGQAYTTDFSNSTIYNESTELVLYSAFDNTGLESDYELYYINTTGKYLWTQGTTNSSGYAIVLLDLPTKSAGTFYNLELLFSKTYYQNFNKSVSIRIEQGDLNISYQYTDTTYLNETTIKFLITTPNGFPVSGILVDLSYWMDGNYVYSQTSESINGIAILTFIPPEAGTLSLSLWVHDAYDNYKEYSNTITIEVSRANSRIDYELVDVDGNAYLMVDLKTITNSSFEGTVSIDIGYGSQSYNISGITAIPIEISSGTYINLSFLGDSNTFETTSSGLLEIQDIEILLDTTMIFANSSNMISFIVSSPTSSINNHEFELYLNNSEWKFINTSYSINGIVEYNIPLLDEGTYELRLEYPQQSYFNAQSVIFDIEVVKQNITVTANYDELLANTPSSLSFTINSNENLSYIELPSTISIYDGNEWIVLYDGIINSNQTISIVIPLQLGSYSMKIETHITSKYHASTLELNVNVVQSAELQRYESDIFYYLGNNSYYLILSDSLTADPIVGATLDILFCNPFCSSAEYLTSITTNSSGIAEFIIPIEFTPDFYTFKAVFNSDLVSSSAKHEFEIQIFPTRLELQATFTDYGITHNTTIELSVYNSDGILIDVEGIIFYTIDNQESFIEYFGNSVFIVVNDVLEPVEFSAMFEPNGTYFEVVNSVSQTLSRDQINNVDITFNENVFFGSEIEFYFSHQNTSLDNIFVNIVANSTTIFSGYTNYGYVIEVIDIVPGNYELFITISSQVLQQGEIIYNYDMIVYTGNETFNFNFGNDNTIEVTDEIEISILDTVVNGTYEFVLFNDTYVHKAILNNGNQIFIDGLLYPGLYSINITRIHPFMTNVTISKQFQVTPILITLDVIGDEEIIEFSPSRNPLNYSSPNIHFTISNDSYEETLFSNRWVFEHDLSPGTYSIEFSIEGIFSGNGSSTISIGYINSENSSLLSEPEFTTINESIEGFVILIILMTTVIVGVVKESNILKSN